MFEERYSSPPVRSLEMRNCPHGKNVPLSHLPGNSKAQSQTGVIALKFYDMGFRLKGKGQRTRSCAYVSEHEDQI